MISRPVHYLLFNVKNRLRFNAFLGEGKGKEGVYGIFKQERCGGDRRGGKREFCDFVDAGVRAKTKITYYQMKSAGLGSGE